LKYPALDVQGGDAELVLGVADDYLPTAAEEIGESLTIFFRDARARDGAQAAIAAAFPGAAIAAREVDDEDWARRSQENLQPITVGRLTIFPSLRDLRPLRPSPESRVPSPVAIIIQPSMGFGTGHHATTRLCLAHLQQIALRNRTIIDVGTGSGVLAIAASRLGAMHVLAVDDDADAIQSARENLELNPAAEVTLRLADLRDLMSSFDVVLANLTAGLLVATARSLERFTTPAGRLVLSGFMTGEAEEVIGAFASCTIEHRSQEDEWVCVTLLRSR
jgi:ribosomal protein L11 methyltransferase